MSLKDNIIEKWKEAYKNKNENLKSAFAMVKAKILVEEKSGKYELPLKDELIESLIVKEVKELKETQSFYKFDDINFIDIQEKIDALSTYLPKQLSEEEVKEMIIAYITANELDNVGNITGAVVKEVGSKFDKSKISQLVKEVLSK